MALLSREILDTDIRACSLLSKTKWNKVVAILKSDNSMIRIKVLFHHFVLGLDCEWKELLREHKKSKNSFLRRRVNMLNRSDDGALSDSPSSAFANESLAE